MSYLQIADSYDTSTSLLGYTIQGGNYGTAQSFEGDGRRLYSSKFLLTRTGSPVYDVMAKIYPVTGTHGSNARPTGSPLAVSETVLSSSVSTTRSYIEFYFKGVNRIKLEDGQYYCVSIEPTNYDGVILNHITVSFRQSGSTHIGNYSLNNSGTWSGLSNGDLLFSVITKPLKNPLPGNN